jgi:enoyl-CoA hydratase
MNHTADILFERRGAAGLVTLNRPQALGAVTHAMVLALRTQLDAWAEDAAVTRVVVTSAPGRAFSAGGDIRALYELGRAGRHDEALQFWRDEYPLNAVIKTYRKPYVALIDGIVMGGGVGVSVHGSHRVAGDRYVFAMPEVGIGFFPDVGAVLAAFAEPAGEGPLALYRATIDRLFDGASVEAILAKLDGEAASGSAVADWSRKVATNIRTKSPTSLKLALAQMQRGADWSFSECMQAEFRIVSRIVHGHDFYEGVRAAIIDKDNAPRWRPAALDAVTPAEVERHFATLGDGELALP